MPRTLKLAFVALATGFVLPLAGPSGCASSHGMSRSDALMQAGLYIEGPSTIPPEVSARVLADSGALQLYDDLLNGRQKWEPVADSAMMLRWLALSEQPRFLPTFLHYANPNLPIGRGNDVFSYASVGLARLVTLPAARQRLIELGQPSTPAVYREGLVRILAFRNTEGTREVLRSIYTDDLSPYVRKQAAAASAQDYPVKPVRIVEPFGVGGGPDLLARVLAPRLSELWGQPVTVENHPGAGATAGPALVATSPADGYTLLINTSAQAYSVVLSKTLPYDPLKDFVPVASLTYQPYVLVVGKPAGITTVRELIAAAKMKPGALKFGSTGAGTGTHLGIVRFNREAGIRGTDVPPQPTDGIADVLAATIEGRTTYMLAPISITLAPIRDGKLFALGVTTARRAALLPEVPTIAEAGVAGFDFPIWYGIWVRAGTPTAVIDKVSKDVARVLAAPDLRVWIAQHGAEPMGMTRAAFTRFVQSESESAVRLNP